MTEKSIIRELDNLAEKVQIGEIPKKVLLDKIHYYVSLYSELDAPLIMFSCMFNAKHLFLFDLENNISDPNEKDKNGYIIIIYY